MPVGTVEKPPIETVGVAGVAAWLGRNPRTVLTYCQESHSPRPDMRHGQVLTANCCSPLVECSCSDGCNCGCPGCDCTGPIPDVEGRRWLVSRKPEWLQWFDTYGPGRPRRTSKQRAELAAELRGKYEAGDTVRELATRYGFSYGRTYDLLNEADTQFRTRGGTPITRARRSRDENEGSQE